MGTSSYGGTVQNPLPGSLRRRQFPPFQLTSTFTMGFKLKAAVLDFWNTMTEMFLFLNPANVGEPFISGSMSEKINLLVVLVILAILHGWTVRWVFEVYLWPSKYNLSGRNTCSKYAIAVLCIISFGSFVFIYVAAWVNSRSRLKHVLVGKHLDLPDPETSKDSFSAYRPGRIKDALSELQGLRDQALNCEDKQDELAKEKGDRPVLFLRSEYGQGFLHDIAFRVQRLQLLDGQMVRQEKWRKLLLGSIISLCCWAAVGGARLQAEKCLPANLAFGFMEIITITLITLIAASTFLGYSEYVHWITETLTRHPLSKDEKFLISLLALNTNLKFRGFQATQDYADVTEPGNVDAFIPMEGVLRAYTLEDFV